MDYIGPQGLVPPIYVKPVYWGLWHMERPTDTKFDIKACILTLNVITKYYFNRFSGYGTAHLSQIGIQASCAHETFDSDQI